MGETMVGSGVVHCVRSWGDACVGVQRHTSVPVRVRGVKQACVTGFCRTGSYV
jgi:hypothetical protein